MIADAMQWFAVVLAAAALVTAFSALTARSMFVMCVNVAATGALGAATLLALGAGDAALALALVGVAWSPVILLSAMALSNRTAKQLRRGWPWLSLLAGLATFGAMMAVEVDVAAPVAGESELAGLAAWLAPLALVGAAIALCLLGYGERGALGSRERDL